MEEIARQHLPKCHFSLMVWRVALSLMTLTRNCLLMPIADKEFLNMYERL